MTMTPLQADARDDRRWESGITAVDLLVGVALMVLILLLVYANFFVNHRVYDVQSEIASMQAEARRVGGEEGIDCGDDEPGPTDAMAAILEAACADGAVESVNVNVEVDVVDPMFGEG